MNRYGLRLIGLLAVVAFFLTACNLNIVRGSGDIVTEARNVSDFERVALSGSGELIIIQDGEESLTIETDDNVMQYIKSEVRGETLELDFDPVRTGSISPTRLTFTLHVNDLRSLDIAGSGMVTAESIVTDRLDVEVSGSGNIEVDSLMADVVETKISGSGEVNLSGEITKQAIEISGSGKYETQNLRCETAIVDVSGSGKATVWATDALETHIAGSGSVSYYGNPKTDSSTSGSGTVRSLGEK